MEARRDGEGWLLRSNTRVELGPLYVVDQGRFWRLERLGAGATALMMPVTDPGPLLRGEFSYHSQDQRWASMYSIAGPLTEAALGAALWSGSTAALDEPYDLSQLSLEAHDLGLGWGHAASQDGEVCPVLVALSQVGRPPLEIPDLSLFDTLVVHRQTLCGEIP